METRSFYHSSYFSRQSRLQRLVRNALAGQLVGLPFDEQLAILHAARALEAGGQVSYQTGNRGITVWNPDTGRPIALSQRAQNVIAEVARQISEDEANATLELPRQTGRFGNTSGLVYPPSNMGEIDNAFGVLSEAYGVSVADLRRAAEQLAGRGRVPSISTEGETLHLPDLGVLGQRTRPSLEPAGETTGQGTVAPRLDDAATETTKPTPLRDWVEARKSADGRRRDSKPIADVLEEFIRTTFADELAAGEMTTQKLYRYEGLHSAFYNHKAKLPRDLQDMQTRSELNDRMVAEGKVRPEPPGSDYYTARSQVRAARQRGVVPPI